MMLTGQRVNPKKARKMKLVDQTADPTALHFAAVQAAKGLADNSLKVDRSPKGMEWLIRYVLEQTELGRNFVFKKAREQVMKQTKGVYPAPLRVRQPRRRGCRPSAGSGGGA
jgi:enoyl-CoA hydratase/carnithine racemase